MDDRRDRTDPAGSGDAPLDPGATFETVRVRDGRRASVAVAALTVAVVGLVGAAILGGTTAGDRSSEAAVAASVAAGSAVPASTSAAATSRPLGSGAAAGPDAEAGRLLAVETRTSGRLILVHGDVFTINAVVVIVSLVDTADRLIGIESVDMPGGSTALRLGGNDRFDLAFRLADARAPAWIEANAYDRIGQRIATARAPVQVPFEPLRSRFGAGS